MGAWEPMELEHCRYVVSTAPPTCIGLVSWATLECHIKRQVMIQTSCSRSSPVLHATSRSIVVQWTEHLNISELWICWAQFLHWARKHLEVMSGMIVNRVQSGFFGQICYIWDLIVRIPELPAPKLHDVIRSKNNAFRILVLANIIQRGIKYAISNSTEISCIISLHWDLTFGRSSQSNIWCWGSNNGEVAFLLPELDV